jgi:mevalonate kinase
MIRVSAPGKVYLCGEHAVVYGKHGICASISMRTRVSVESSDEFIIESFSGVSRGHPSKLYPYVAGAIKKIENLCEITPVKITISSEIPPASGLGSSASVTVATIKALSKMFGVELEKEEIARMAHEVEKEVQGSASRTDTYVSTFGGVLMLPEGEKLPVPNTSIIIAFTGVTSSTKELVASVRRLRERHPKVIDGVMEVIDSIAILVKERLKEGDLLSIGELMNINQGLLDSIGVSTEQISSIVYRARSSGAYGAKITGAGGGGSVVILSPSENSEKILNEIKPLCKEVFLTSIDTQGVREE